MTDIDYKSILGNYYNKLDWNNNESVGENLARNIVSVIRSNISSGNYTEKWDEQQSGCGWIITQMRDFFHTFKPLCGVCSNIDIDLLENYDNVNDIETALAENFNIRFLCNFYLFSVVGGSGNSMYIMYTETKKENKHPLIRFELND
jgi:hypothetical protein